MKTHLNYLGIWMDETKAYLIDPEKGELESLRCRQRPPRLPGKGATGMRLGNFRSTNNEYSVHRKMESMKAEYFESLSSRVEPYDEIVLFGPSHAMSEFYNKVRKGKTCRNTRIHLEPADRMTKNQRQAYVRKYFSGK